MRKALTIFVGLCVVGSTLSFAGARDQKHRITRKPAAIQGDEPVAVSAKSQALHKTTAIGPGTVLMESTYDYGSNGGVLSNLVDYGDGTLAVGRMGATDAGTTDRGTFFSYFDGTTWSPMTKVEQARRGWSNISALADGRSVTSSHVATEVNVDALKGFGIWTSTLTGGVTGVPAPTWPRMTIDGADNIIICATDGSGAPYYKQVSISRDGGNTWTNVALEADTTTRVPAFGADDQAIASQGNKVAVVVAETGNDLHLWSSADNGATWTYRKLTDNPVTLPPDGAVDLPAGSCDALYDNNGNLHIFFETFLGLPDSAGNVALFESTGSGIYHWSEAAGLSEVADFGDIPGADLEIGAFSGNLGAFDQHNVDGNVVCQPSAGVDANNNLYLLFASFRPNDFDPDSAHYTDIYATGSKDGGKTWGVVVNVTNSPQAEDTWAALAENIGDSLRFVYSSDGSTGNSIQGGGAAPTSYLYYAFPKSAISLDPRPSAVNDRTSEVPANFALHASFPNPFNPSTQISFDLAKSVRVKLSVYDVTGKLVATLVNGKLEAGTHNVTWNAQGQPSGVYFAKMEAEGFSQVQKMTLLK